MSSSSSSSWICRLLIGAWWLQSDGAVWHPSGTLGIAPQQLLDDEKEAMRPVLKMTHGLESTMGVMLNAYKMYDHQLDPPARTRTRSLHATHFTSLTSRHYRTRSHPRPLIHSFHPLHPLHFTLLTSLHPLSLTNFTRPRSPPPRACFPGTTRPARRPRHSPVSAASRWSAMGTNITRCSPRGSAQAS